MSGALAIIGLLLLACAETTDVVKGRDSSAGTALVSLVGMLCIVAGLGVALWNY